MNRRILFAIVIAAALAAFAFSLQAGDPPAIGASVVGISVDDVESHDEFATKYKLPFTLLADENGETSDAYGVLRDWKLIQIASRQSFLLDPQGVIVKHYEEVDPDTHTQEVLADLEALMAEAG